jgi:hypothetical protein
VQTTHRNPSYNYTVDQVDDIIDRLLNKRRLQPTVEEIFNLGLSTDTYALEQYVVARWHGERASTKRRTKLLSERMSSIVGWTGNHEKNENAVWKVYSYDFGVLCYASGAGRESVREFSWSMYGWMIPENKRDGRNSSGLNVQLVGMGGPIEAAKRMAGMIGTLEDEVSRREKQARDAIKSARQTRQRVEVIKLNLLGSLNSISPETK